MKTLHVVFSFPPDPPGGTELYVAALCRELKAQGLEANVAAPGAKDSRYRHDGLTVRRFEMQEGALGLGALYGDGDDVAAESFERLLDEERPDLVHQHAITPACSIQLIDRARRRGLPVVFTYHTPTATCQRGTLLEWGTTPCDGRLDAARCGACTLHGLGLGRGTSKTLAHLPSAAGRVLERAGLQGGPWTALRMSSLMDKRVASSQRLVASVDAFIALAPWVEQLMLANGVPAHRITRVSHGIVARRPPARRRTVSTGRLRIAHLGRVDPVKGTKLLIDAMRAVPHANVCVDIFGVVQSSEAAELLDSWRRAANDDGRIRFLPPMDYDTVVDRLAEYDMVAIPSQWMETGPLVALEAFAAGVPVIASDLGGLADKIHDDVDGLLVRPYHAVDAWSATLARVATDRPLVARLTQGVRPPRAMSDVAREMQAVYERICGAERTRQAVRVPQPEAVGSR